MLHHSLPETDAAQQAKAMSALLPAEREQWYVPAAHDTLDREVILERFGWIHKAGRQVLGSTAALTSGLDEDYEASVAFVQDAFNEFESQRPSSEQSKWSFFVPVRGEEGQGDIYASEVTPRFLPILDPRWGVNAMQLQRSVAHLAPTKIESYQGDGDANGFVMFTPAYIDPVGRFDRKHMVTNVMPAAQRRVAEAAQYAHSHFGVEIAGLGAVIPALTNSGRTINQEGLVTTTGHAGTVHLMSETTRRVTEEMIQKEDITIGVLGLGMIGRAAYEVVADSEIDASVKNYLLYDAIAERTVTAVSSRPDTRTRAMQTTHELLQSSDVILSAITDSIDLDEYERKHAVRLDLHGKVIIDDSQPGCFQREQVEQRGGKLVWVVGNDNSEGHTLERINGYPYGDKVGLIGKHALWGCEAEVGSLALTGRLDLAVRTPVNREIAHQIGTLGLEQVGVTVSQPFQSYGQPVAPW